MGCRLTCAEWLLPTQLLTGAERALTAGVCLEEDAVSSLATLAVPRMGQGIAIPRVAVAR